jgi:hypothetical protein
MSDFAFLDGFEGYASELPIARLDSRPCRPKAGKVVRQMENLSFLIQCAGPMPTPKEARDLHRRFDESLKGTADQDQA